MRAFTVVDAPQRSDEWRYTRLGLLTGSSAADMLASIKSGEAAARRDLRLRLITERMTAQPQEDVYINPAMQRGIDCEPLARGAYETATGELVRASGFLKHTSLLAGCSLDGHVGDFEGIIEIKVPKSATHLRYLRAGAVPADHLAQIRHNLWITGAAWCDFVSWDDRFPVHLQLFIARISREECDIPGYETKALAFLEECETEFQSLRGWAAARKG